MKTTHLSSALHRLQHPHGIRVHYVAIGGKKQPSDLMQPKVRRVYTALAKRGPLTMPELQRAVHVDRNTVRFAVQVLRQAALVMSERA